VAVKALQITNHADGFPKPVISGWHGPLHSVLQPGNLKRFRTAQQTLLSRAKRWLTVDFRKDQACSATQNQRFRIMIRVRFFSCCASLEWSSLLHHFDTCHRLAKAASLADERPARYSPCISRTAPSFHPPFVASVHTTHLLPSNQQSRNISPPCNILRLFARNLPCSSGGRALSSPS
jgi:hypothetical protein